MNTPEISIVSPVYRAEEIVPELVQRIRAAVEKITPHYEIILVEDRGPDNSWEVIQKMAKEHPMVRGFRLSRNFGQHATITAGLEQVRGNWVVVMDCDLQDQPEEIEKLYYKAQEGYDIVFAKRQRRKDSFFKKKFSQWFYSILGYLTETEQDPEVANFGIYRRKAIEAILDMKDFVRYFPTMVKWVGYKRAFIYVEHSERFSGESSYNFRSLFRLALNIILSFSDKPLRLTVQLGMFISSISFLMAIATLIRFFMGHIMVSGYASLIVSIWFLSGIIITLLGVLGLYVGRIFDQTKGRPVFIIDEHTEE